MGTIDLFQNHMNYSEFRNSSGFSAPNVSVCFEEKEVHYNPIDPSYITFTPVGNEEVYVALNAGIDNSGGGDRRETEDTDSGYTYEISIDNGEWQPYVYGSEITLANSSHNVRFRHALGSVETFVNGSETPFAFGDGFDDDVLSPIEGPYGLEAKIPEVAVKKRIGRFYLDGGLVDCTGNIATLLDGRGASRKIDELAFMQLFANCKNLHSAPTLPYSTLSRGCYYMMFYGCTALTQSPQLNATSIADFCYYGMFAFCYSMTTGPLRLPATTIYAHSYQLMFFECSSLTQTPLTLPASRLNVTEYYDESGNTIPSPGRGDIGPKKAEYSSPKIMEREFTNILLGESSSISTLYLLNQSGIWDNVFTGFFEPLVGCYAFMFAGCSSLLQAPSLPATILGSACYQGMFANCTSLAQAPSLPAQKTEQGCYYMMFYGCRQLTTTPSLVSTTTSIACYSRMFSDCVGLTSAMTILPSKTVVFESYSYMFAGCTSLTTAPELPATTAVYFRGYEGMFSGCSSLNYIKCMIVEDIYNNTDYTSNWVAGVAATGTFVQFKEATWTGNSVNAIPIGWTVNKEDVQVNYLRFSPATSQPVDVYLTSFWDEQTDEMNNPQYQYSINNGDWSNYEWVDGVSGKTITLSQGDTVRLRRALSTNGGELDKKSSSIYPKIGNAGIQFHFSGGTVNASGSVNTLLEWSDSIRNLKTMNSDFDDNFGGGHFISLFMDCVNLVSAPELPSTTLGNYSYANMFEGCTGLVNPPSLSAITELSTGSCYSMFEGCTAMTSVPQINVDYLPRQCYYRMFAYDFSLTSAAPITAMSAEPSSCFAMYGGCTALTTPMPTLPAYIVEGGIIDDSQLAQSQNPISKTEGDIKLGASEYAIGDGIFEDAVGDADYGHFSFMFCDCSNLLSAPELPAMTMGKGCYLGMFMNCTSLIIAPDLPSTKLSRGCYSAMFAGCESMTSAMTSLPATTLVDSCYYGMFSGCTSLTKAPKIKGRLFGNGGGFRREISYSSSACCAEMFSNCSLLNEIEVWFETQPIYLYNNELRNWVNGVSNSGTFTYHSDYNWDAENQSEGNYDRIPYGWTVTPPLNENVVVN